MIPVTDKSLNYSPFSTTYKKLSQYSQISGHQKIKCNISNVKPFIHAQEYSLHYWLDLRDKMWLPVKAEDILVVLRINNEMHWLQMKQLHADGALPQTSYKWEK